MSSSFQPEIDNVLGFFKRIKFTKHLSIYLLATTVDAINGDVKKDDLMSVLVENVPAEHLLREKDMDTLRL